MIEGMLYAGANPKGYAIGSPGGPGIRQGQSISLLGGNWVAGHIEYSESIAGVLTNEADSKFSTS